MDFNKLELFLDIASTKNLTLTAQNFGYTQSAVSHTIKKLESELGFPLIKRTNRGVILTRDGQNLLPAIRTAITAYHHMEEAIEAIQGIQRGNICIGTYSSIAINWLPAIIKKFQHLYPDITIQIREGGLEEIETWMQEGIVDFGLISQMDGRSYDFIPLCSEPLYAVFPKDYEFSENHFPQPPFPVTAFRDYPFVASESGIDDDVAAALQNADVVPSVAFYCKDDHSIIAMVENGLGISLLPSLILEGTEHRIRKFPLNPPSHRVLGVGMLSYEALSLSARAFIAMVQDFVASNAEEHV